MSDPFEQLIQQDRKWCEERQIRIDALANKYQSDCQEVPKPKPFKAFKPTLFSSSGRSWRTALEAATEIGSSRSAISNAMAKKCRCKGLCFSRKSVCDAKYMDNHFRKKSGGTRYTTPVEIEGYGSFVSMEMAAKATGKSSAVISQCLSGKMKCLKVTRINSAARKVAC